MYKDTHIHFQWECSIRPSITYRFNSVCRTEIMGKSLQFIRICLQRSLLPTGAATKTGKKNYNYYISPKLLKEYVGDWKQ